MKTSKIQVLTIASLMLLSCGQALAAFDFEAVSVRGGRDIRFNPAKPGREVRNEELQFAVVNTEGRRYRILQQQIAPFTNERGQRLSPETVQIFSSSSVGGTLGVRFPTPLRAGQQAIYTSDNSGTPENFVLQFALQLQPGDAAGRYQTQLVYQMEAVQGGVAPITQVVHVHVDIDPDFSFTARDVRGGSSVRLGRISERKAQGEGAVQVDIAGMGVPYRVTLSLAGNLTSGSGRRIDGENLNFRTSNPSTGTVRTPEGNLGTDRIVVYESDNSGSAAQFQVGLSTADLSSTYAGLYTGQLEFNVESSGGMPLRPERLQIEVEVEPIFNLEVTNPQGGGLNFGHFSRPGDRQNRSMVIRAKSNTGEPYKVTQTLTRLFTNEQGRSLPKEQFIGVTQGAKQGTLAMPVAAPIDAGQTLLYTSDNKGTSDEFTVEYSLTLPQDAPGGSYTTETTYSLAII